jgi:hypothetical protein
MKVHVENVVEANAQEFLGYGRDATTGDPVLIVVCGVRRVVISMSPLEAKELGCGAIFAAGVCAQERMAREGNQAGAAGGLLDGNGIPLRTVQ